MNLTGELKYLVAILSVIVTLIQLLKTILKDWPNLLPSLIRWRKMVTLKGEFIELSYLRAIKKLRSHEEKSDLAHPLEQQVYKDSIERLIARYVDAKYGYNFTGAFQAFVLCIFWLILTDNANWIPFIGFQSLDASHGVFWCTTNSDFGDFRLLSVFSSICKR